jgi:hypothetical protein
MSVIDFDVDVDVVIFFVLHSIVVVLPRPNRGSRLCLCITKHCHTSPAHICVFIPVYGHTLSRPQQSKKTGRGQVERSCCL